MRVLVTRPREDAEATAKQLLALGHAPLVEPLLQIEFLAGAPLSLEGVQAFLATSSNGVRALAKRTRSRKLPLFAVGSETAAAARAEGFETIHDAQGDATRLADLVSRSLDPHAGALIHATGAEAEGMLANSLGAAGFTVSRDVLYRTPAVPVLPRAIAEALKAASLDAVLHFSRRSARIFRERVVEAGLEARCASVAMFCLSAATAEGLGTLPHLELRVASAPNQAALLACLPPA